MFCVNLYHTFHNHITTTSPCLRLEYQNRILRWARHVTRMPMSRALWQFLESWEAYYQPAGCLQMTWGRAGECARK